MTRHRVVGPSKQTQEKTVRNEAVGKFNRRFEAWKHEHRISVYRALDNNRLKFLSCHAESDVDEDFVRELYGAGKYTLKLIDGAGRWLSQATISIGKRHL